ncbi:MAG: hypothetical protein K0S55_2161 [Clostridia bacterium]|nr:hypothetical protein [Clostridia bacterium]
MLSDINECTAITICIYIINIIIDLCFSNIKLEHKLLIIAVNGLAVIICILAIIGKITETGPVFRINENAMVFANLDISKYYFLILMFLDIGIPVISYISKKNRDK